MNWGHDTPDTLRHTTDNPSVINHAVKFSRPDVEFVSKYYANARGIVMVFKGRLGT